MSSDCRSTAVEHSQQTPAWPEKTNPQRAHYPSDVNDDQWRQIAGFLARSKTVGRPNQHSLRDVVDAVNYRWQTGCSWRMLPHDFPPWTTVYTHLRNWQRRGVLRRLRETLVRPARPQTAKLETVAALHRSGDN